MRARALRSFPGFLTVAAVLGALAGGACSQGPEDGGPDVACILLEGDCIELRDDHVESGHDAGGIECSGGGGQVVPSCSRDELVGICETGPDETGSFEQRTFFYDGSADSLATVCLASNGAWSGEP